MFCNLDVKIKQRRWEDRKRQMNRVGRRVDNSKRKTWIASQSKHSNHIGRSSYYLLCEGFFLCVCDEQWASLITNKRRQIKN